MAMNPYEWLYATESQPLKEYVLDEVAKHLAKAVEHFPPAIEEWENDELRLRFEAIVARGIRRPALDVVRVGLKLYRWELERDLEAIDRYVRGERGAELGLADEDVELALFLYRFWMDQTLAFKEYAGNKFRWSELLGLADRLDSRLVNQQSPLRN